MKSVKALVIIIIDGPDSTMSEFTRSVLVLRLSSKWIGRGVNMSEIVKSCTYSVNAINPMLTLC